MTKSQADNDASGAKDNSPPNHRQETLNICQHVVTAHKSVLASNETDLHKLSRDMTKAFITASAIVTRLNRVK